jgi:hypothetical protein
MILGNASNVIWNGATVNSVWCNQTKIWPTSTPAPETWRAEGFYYYPPDSSNEKLGTTLCFVCTDFTGQDSSILSKYTMYTHPFTNPYTGYTSFTGSSLNTSKILKNVHLVQQATIGITSEYPTSTFITGYVQTKQALVNASGLWESANYTDYWGFNATGTSASGNTYFMTRYNNGLRIGVSYSLTISLSASALSAKFANWAATGANSRTATAYGSASHRTAASYLFWTASGEY